MLPSHRNAFMKNVGFLRCSWKKGFLSKQSNSDSEDFAYR